MEHPQSPDVVFKQLFKDLHASGLWKDGKSISDATPRAEPSTILSEYEKTKSHKDFNLEIFFNTYFIPFESQARDFKSDMTLSVKEHIEKLWPLLTRSADEHVTGSSLLPLPNPYIVPGGRFNEVYYWDSFFTMLGLQVSGHIDIVTNMIDNFAWMLDTYGLIPNGNRTYYLGRSQPPFFALMVDLLAQSAGDDVYTKYENALLQEYKFWMSGSTKEMNPDQHLVTLSNGEILNRYFDKFNTPRPEMYQDDVNESSKTGQDEEIFYQNIRAAAASGWDFSARWMDKTAKLSTIHTSDIIPIDLNCLLYFLETTIAKTKAIHKDTNAEAVFQAKANQRKKNILTYCWNENEGCFCDYNFRKQEINSFKSLATVFPLYFNIATAKQAASVANMIANEFLKPGGVVTTNISSGQQWDSPNGWAPLQWMTYQGLINYGHIDLANEIKNRWLSLNEKVFKDTGKMLEKYNVENIELLSGGGEYPVQDGFGWTNGVYLKLLSQEK